MACQFRNVILRS